MWPFLSFALIPAGMWAAYRASARIPFSGLRKTAQTAAGFVAITSALMLVVALPSGSIDILDLWRFLAYAIVPFVLAVVYIRSNDLSQKWFRPILRIANAAFLVGAALMFLLLCVTQSACVTRASPQYSPDGRYVAVQQFYQGSALEEDSSNVYIRRTWWPFATLVYRGRGEHRAKYPRVRWLDDFHLLLTYADSHDCRPSVGALQIVCESAPRRTRASLH